MSEDDKSIACLQSDDLHPTLNAILFADLAQYSKLVAEDENATLTYVARCFDIFKEKCPHYGGEFIKTLGDGVLVLFDSASAAVDYAIEVQNAVAGLAPEQPEVGSFRIGVHMGEVYRQDGDVFGHAVNVASRVEGQAKPGGLCVTQEVFLALRNSAPYSFNFAGRHHLKNLPEPQSLYHVGPPVTGRRATKVKEARVSVVDGFEIRSDDDHPIALRSRMTQALLGYLAVVPGNREQLDRLATLLWPDRTMEQARRALNSAIRQAQRALERASSGALQRSGSMLALRCDRLSIDVGNVLEKLERGEVDVLLQQRPDLAASVLLGFEDVSRLFNAWLKVTRHNLHEQVVAGLEALLDRFDLDDPALRHAASVLTLVEPSHEQAVRQLIRHYGAVGNAAAAKRAYERLEQVLKDDYGISPSPATVAVMRALNTQRPVARAPDGAKGREAHRPVIAVAPLVTSSERFGYAVTGLRSELIASLSKFREWVVIEAPESGASLEPSYLLNGELSSAGQDVQVVFTLQEVPTRKIVWSDSYSVSRESWPHVQSRLLGKIASTLEVYLSQDRLSRILGAPTYDLDTYDSWLKGEHLLTFWSPETEVEAKACFEYAIAQDPSFAPAYASLASVLNSRRFIWPGAEADEQERQRALELSQRAMEIDPLDTRNQMVVAWSTALVQEYEQAEVHFELAVGLNPNDPSTLVSAALGMAYLGRLDRALELLERVEALSSMLHDYQWSHIATLRCLVGDFEGAIRAADRSGNVIVDTPGWKAIALCRLGRKKEAADALAQMCESAAAAWHGSAAADRAAVLSWFFSIFPIRSKKTKAALSRCLKSI